MLGNYHTNQLSIEIQLMRRFIENMHIRSLANLDMVGSEHLFIFRDSLGAKSGGSASDTLFGQTAFLTSNFTNLTSLQTNVNVTLLSPFILYTFDSVSLSYLRTCYQTFIPDVDFLEIPQLCCKHRTARISCTVFLKPSYKCHFHFNIVIEIISNLQFLIKKYSIQPTDVIEESSVMHPSSPTQLARIHVVIFAGYSEPFRY